MYCSVLCRRNVKESISIKREWVRLIIKQPTKDWFSLHFPTAPRFLSRSIAGSDYEIEESWASGKKAQKNARNSPKLLNEEPLQRVENDIDRKNYAPTSFKNPCPGIKTLNHIES